MATKQKPKTSMLEVRQAWMLAKHLSFGDPSNEQVISRALDALAYWDVKSVDNDLALSCIQWIDGVSSLHGPNVTNMF
jgi:hypothetical protein